MKRADDGGGKKHCKLTENAADKQQIMFGKSIT